MSSIVSILQAASTFDLTTLKTAKAELGITGTKQDPDLKRWIHEASSQIASYLKRVLAKETIAETFTFLASDNAHRESLQLARYPIVSITSVVADSTTLDTTEYEVDAEAGMLFRLGSTGSRCYWRNCRIVVTYVAGYPLLGNLPRDIERACLIVLQERKASGGRDPNIRRENVPGVYEVELWAGGLPGEDAAMPPKAAALLEHFRDVQV